MAAIEKKPIKITETVLRDAQIKWTKSDTIP